MERTIHVTIRDKIATASGDARYICGNSDFVIQFDFDDEWSGIEYKTALFLFNGKCIPRIFSGNQCPVPVISGTYNIHLGVFAGDLQTTTSAYIPAKKSILCGVELPTAPEPDIYNQIMDKLNSGELKGPKGDPGEKGNPGNVLYAAFSTDEAGNLIMTTPDGYEGPLFAINETGDLEVIVNE